VGLDVGDEALVLLLGPRALVGVRLLAARGPPHAARPDLPCPAEIDARDSHARTDRFARSAAPPVVVVAAAEWESEEQRRACFRSAGDGLVAWCVCSQAAGASLVSWNEQRKAGEPGGGVVVGFIRGGGGGGGG